MIKDVLDWFKSELAEQNKKNRYWFDKTLGHDVYIRQGLILRILYVDLAKAFTSYNEHAHAENDKRVAYNAELYADEEYRTMLSPKPYYPFLGPAGNNTGDKLAEWMRKDPTFSKVVKDMLQRKILNKKYMEKFMAAANPTEHAKLAPHNYISKTNQYEIKLEMRAGSYSKKAVTKKGTKTFQNWINKAMIGAYHDTFASIRDKVGDEFGTGIWWYYGNYERDPVTGTKQAGGRQKKAGLAGVTSGSQTKSLTRAHQKTTQGKNLKVITPVGGQQKTVSRLTLAKSAKVMASKVMIKTDGTVLRGGAYEDLRYELINGLEETYELKELRDVNTNQFDLTQVLNIEITDRSGNKGLIDHFDSSGVRKTAEEAMRKKAGVIAVLYGKSVTEMEGSPKVKDVVRDMHVATLISNLLGIKHMARPDMRLKVNKQLLRAAKKAKVKRRRKVGTWAEGLKGGKPVLKAGAAAKAYRAGSGKDTSKVKRVKGSRAAGRVAESPIALRNLLNEALPQMVASKMVSPALRFRTGRFANSVRVDMIHQGPRGGIGVDYTYQRDPYETFEPGNKQGSTQRDPKKIIGESIRELATGILGKQPHTIRRT